MLIECRYWMASPMLFMISEASEAAKKPSEAFSGKVKRVSGELYKPAAKEPG